MKIKFIPVDYDSFDFNGRNYMKIIGRSREGKRICVIDEYEANFWVIFKDKTSEKKAREIQEKISKIEIENSGRKTKVLRTELKDKKFLGKDVKAIQVFITNHKDGHAVADKIDFKEVDKRREYDIPLITKYIIDKKVEPLVWYDIEGEVDNRFGLNNLEVDLCIRAEKIVKSEQAEFEPRILAFDIEADEFELGKGNVLMISLYGDNFKKVLTWKKCSKSQSFVECLKSEEEMIEKFVGYVKEYNPDLLVGYFSDGFDLPYLRAAAEKNKIKLSLGLDGKQPNFARGRIPKARIDGIVHIDLFRFIDSVYSQYLQSETLSLDDVSSELLGENKHDFDFNKLDIMKEDDWREFFEYNLRDSELTYKLAEKFWPDMVEFCKIIKEPLFEITRDAMSVHVENYIIHNLGKYNEIAEKRPLHDEIGKRRMRGKYEGAFVFQPVPGLYEDIAFFDFTSMYASVIVTYNLSLSTYHEKKQDNDLAVDIKDKAYFSNEKGFFPEMLEEIIKLRKKYKKELKENPSPILKARSNAYKLLANASYGYQGFFGARYYCREAAASTAALARKNILDVIEKIKKNKYKIIYSDTDSIAFLRDKKSKKQVLEMLKQINSGLPGIMELELEDFYKRGLWVTKRTGEFGAKKKYALIDENEKMKIRGFETVRRDWCYLARNLQNKILELILKNGNEKKALEILKKTIEDVKNRKVDLNELIIRTGLKKSLEEYKAEGPHVYAAKKMKESGIPVSQGMLIEYYIAESKGKKLIREKVKLPDEKGEYDIDYYLNNQLLPAVENIFEVFGINFKELVDGEKQKKLF